MEDLYFYMICNNCYQQDNLHVTDFKKYVMSDRSSAKRPNGETITGGQSRNMEGQYRCPYGCNGSMGVYAFGTREECDAKEDELFKKYWRKMPNDSLHYVMQGMTPEDAEELKKKSDEELFPNG